MDYINCIGEEPTFHFHWRENGRNFIEARCYKDDNRNLKSLNEYRKAFQDTVWKITSIVIIDNTYRFPNYVWSDEQDWDYIFNESSFIHFYLADKRKAIIDLSFKENINKSLFSHTYQVQNVKRNSQNEVVVNLVGDYSSINLKTLKSFYSWCTKQKYHKEVDTCTYCLRSTRSSKPDIIINYVEKGECFYLDIF